MQTVEMLYWKMMEYKKLLIACQGMFAGVAEQ